eukprot:4345551-Heterocapsa_arctica.AAC.1
MPKEGAESEGQLRPIAILPYIYIGFGWQLGQCKIKQWALRLNGRRFSSPETLVWEVAARSELS